MPYARTSPQRGYLLPRRNRPPPAASVVRAGSGVTAKPPARQAAAPWKLNDWPLRLTVDEARELGTQISELANRYRRAPGDPDPRPGTVRAYFQLQLLPDEPRPAGPEASQ
jgi:hypothetical protein